MKNEIIPARHYAVIALLLLGCAVAFATPPAPPIPVVSDTIPVVVDKSNDTIFSKLLPGIPLSPNEKKRIEPALREWEQLHKGEPSNKKLAETDAFGYQWSDNKSDPSVAAFRWYNIASSGAKIAFDCMDDAATKVAIGFPFRYYGKEYDSVYVSTNGFLSFTTNRAGYQDFPIPTASKPYAVIAPLWNDISLGDGSTFYVKQNRVATDTMVISWYCVPVTSATDTLLFQVQLVRDGSFLFAYHTITYTSSDSIKATIGCEDQTGTIGLQVAYNTEYAASGRVVKFTPPCDWVLPISPANNATAIQRTTALNWAAGPCAESYDVYLSTDRSAVAGMNAAGLIESGVNQTSYTPHRNLLQHTTYYWRVVAHGKEGVARASAVWSFVTYYRTITGVNTPGKTKTSSIDVPTIDPAN